MTMKTFMQLLAFSSLFLLSCGEKTDEPTTKKESNQEISEPDKNYDHVLSEAYIGQRSLHYFDDNAILSQRQVLEVKINDDGTLTINREPATTDDLKPEMHKFYFANRHLGATRTQAYRENDSYQFSDYPFFNYFDRNSFQTYLNQLEKMAKRDSTAKRYLEINKSRFKIFQITRDETLPLLEFGALISIQHSDSVNDSRIAEVENTIAEIICSFRDEVAQEKFGTDYYRIRDMARKEDQAKIEIAYLREMIPAYIMKTNSKDVATNEMQLPPMSPPPSEEIQVKEDEVETR